MKAFEKKNVAAVKVNDEVIISYSVACFGNGSFLVYINGKGVEYVFGTENEALAYVKDCTSLDTKFYGKKANVEFYA